MSIKSLLSIAAAFTFIVAVAPLQAQEPPPPAQQAPQQQAMVVQGELTNVDTDNRTLMLKIQDGSEHEFSYNDETVVSGATQSAAGLATQSGRQVTIEFTEDGTRRMASRIEVQAEQ